MISRDPFQPKWSCDSRSCWSLCIALLGHELFPKRYGKLCLLPFSKLRWGTAVWRANGSPAANCPLLCMACREHGAAVALPGSAWPGLGCSPVCVGPGAHGGPAARAVVSAQQDCLCRPSRAPALELLYLTSLCSECIKTYIQICEVSGLVEGAFGFRV